MNKEIVRMKQRMAALLIAGFVSVFATAPSVFAMALSCPGNQVPIVDSVDTHYDSASGITTTIVVYHCA